MDMSADQLAGFLESKLEHLQGLQADCEKRILRVDEVRDKLHLTEEDLKNTLPGDSRGFRIFDRMRIEVVRRWWSTGRYAEPSDCQHIAEWIQVVQAVLQEVQPEFLRPGESPRTKYFFSAGQAYEAKSTNFKIMKRASSSLAIIDDYLDEEVLDYIQSLEPSIKVEMVTGQKKRISPVLLKALQQTKPNTEARINSRCHDRFLIVDGSEVWHLGASLNGAGRKAFMINKAEDENERNHMLADFGNWWSTGASV